MKTELIKIRNTEIKCSVNDSEILIPIKPFCEILGVKYSAQIDKIKEHEIYSQLYRLGGIVAADGKTREMGCLPLQFFFGWLFSINPSNVAEEAKANVVAYQLECCHILYDHFFAKANFVIQKQQLIISQQELVFTAQNNLKDEKRKLCTFKSMDFDTWKLDRDQLSLFPIEGN